MRRPGLGLVAAGGLLGIVWALPDAPDGIGTAAALLAMLGALLVLPTLPGRRMDPQPDGSSRPERPPIRPLREGEKYDTTVKLVTLPNVPLAELWRQRLKEHGIEAFYKGGSPLAGVYGPQLDAALPAELWVGEHDAERAAQLMRELG